MSVKDIKSIIGIDSCSLIKIKVSCSGYATPYCTKGYNDNFLVERTKLLSDYVGINLASILLINYILYKMM